MITFDTAFRHTTGLLLNAKRTGRRISVDKPRIGLMNAALGSACFMVLTQRLSSMLKLYPDTANTIAMRPGCVRRNVRDFLFNFFLFVYFREGITRRIAPLFSGVFLMAIFRAEVNGDKDFPQLGHMTESPFL